MANLSWQKGADIGTTSQNQLKLIANFSNGHSIPASDGTGGPIDGIARIDTLSVLPAGLVQVRIVAQSGANIAWDLEVYAKLDNDPFHDGLIEEAGGHGH